MAIFSRYLVAWGKKALQGREMYRCGGTSRDAARLGAQGHAVEVPEAVQLLQAVPYTDYLSGEWINWEPWETHLPRELAVMEGYEG